MNLEELFHKPLLWLPAEMAHDIGKWGMKRGLFAPGRFATPKSEINLFSFKLDNPLGLAAGFDKNGELLDFVQQYGFSYVEVGSLTYFGGIGNPKPRLFRLRKEKSLLNRMGLNGHPAHIIVDKLKEAKNPFAVNITKTRSQDIMGDDAIRDITNTYKLVKNLEEGGKLIYITLNVSCPNTAEGKTFEDPAVLEELLSEINKIRGERPILIKFSPNLEEEKLSKLIEVADDRVNGYICGNALPHNHEKYGIGGITGEMLSLHTNTLIKRARERTGKTIIGCGGISTGADASIMEHHGADSFQALTGFIYGGPRFAHEVNKEYLELKKSV